MLGMVILAPDVEKAVKDKLLRFPSKTNVQIAKETGCDRNTVSKYRKEIDTKYDSEFVKIVAGKWIKYYGLAADLLFKYITQLEKYKEEEKQVLTAQGDLIPIPLTPTEKGQLVKIQGDIVTKLCEDAGNGEVREVIRMMRSGKIPIPT